MAGRLAVVSIAARADADDVEVLPVAGDGCSRKSLSAQMQFFEAGVTGRRLRAR